MPSEYCRGFSERLPHWLDDEIVTRDISVKLIYDMRAEFIRQFKSTETCSSSKSSGERGLSPEDRNLFWNNLVKEKSLHIRGHRIRDIAL